MWTKGTDEIKFVIGTVEDYQWAKETIARHGLRMICPLLFSWVSPLQPHQRDKSLREVPAGQTPISRCELAERIIADALPVRTPRKSFASAVSVLSILSSASKRMSSSVIMKSA